MEWKDIEPFHKNAPKYGIIRHPEVQRKYDEDKTTEEELRKELFKNNEIWIMKKNKYPYYFKDNTKHYLIWFNNEINYNLIDFLLRDYDKVIYFENDIENKSIKTISHVHIFINEN
tara:strand:+ start:2046 stop:2393 length:348 start_codon:yes stop_codon:yes gene_type:complete